MMWPVRGVSDMSAYVMDDDVFATLADSAPRSLLLDVIMAIAPYRFTADPWWPGGQRPTDVDDATLREAVAEYLHRMNVESVQYRYPDDWVTVDFAYTPDPHALHDWGDGMWADAGEPAATHALRVIELCRRLEYQSCERPEWHASAAARFLRDLTWHWAGALASHVEAKQRRSEGVS